MSRRLKLLLLAQALERCRTRGQLSELDLSVIDELIV